MMKTIFLLTTALLLISCGEKQPQVEEDKFINYNEIVDYQVLEINLNFLNYFENLKPKDELYTIKSRNLIIIDCTTDIYKVDEIEVDKSLIKEEIKNQLAKNDFNGEFPVFVVNDYEELGNIEHPANYVLVLLISQDTELVRYQEIRKEIFMAINDLRNKLSLEKTGKNIYLLSKSEDETDIRIYNEISKIYPMRYTESILE